MNTPDTPVALPSTGSSATERLFPTLTASHIARIAAHGRRRSTVRGEVLVEPGARPVPLFVVLGGELQIVRPSDAAETLIVALRPGQFSGETNMITGRPALARARVSEPGEVIELDRKQLLALVQTDAELSEILMIVRRDGLADTMSRYLIRRIEDNPSITLRTRTEIVALEGNGHLERIRCVPSCDRRRRDS